MEKPPADIADHAQDFAERNLAMLDLYSAQRMVDLGIPERLIGDTDPYRGRKWQAFVADERSGGSISTGITVNSGVLVPTLLKGQKGARAWAKAKLKDRIGAAIAHEYEEHRHGSHAAALEHAPRTELPITDGARRILRAMGR